jgi:hypothetical protein
MSLAIEAFTDNARSYCEWVESDTHDVLTVRQLLLSLLQGTPYLIVSSSQSYGEEYQEDDLEVDPKRFIDFPFQYYREIFNPLDFSKEPVVGDISDDFADIYIELRHGLKALELGNGVYAIQHWRESYFIHWGEHATSALRAIDQYFRDNR